MTVFNLDNHSTMTLLYKSSFCNRVYFCLLFYGISVQPISSPPPCNLTGKTHSLLRWTLLYRDTKYSGHIFCYGNVPDTWWHSIDECKLISTVRWHTQVHVVLIVFIRARKLVKLLLTVNLEKHLNLNLRRVNWRWFKSLFMNLNWVGRRGFM